MPLTIPTLANVWREPPPGPSLPMRAALEAIARLDDEGLRTALGDLLGATSFHGRVTQVWRRHRQRARLQELARAAVNASNLTAVQRLMPMLGRRARRRVAQKGLVRAAEGGYHDLLVFLLRFSDPLSARFDDHYNHACALQKAVHHGHASVVSTLLPYYLTNDLLLNDALFTAARDGQVMMIDLLLPHVNLRTRDRNHCTALMIAAKEGHVPMVHRLLPLIDPNAQDNQGNTALMIAATRGCSEVVAALLPHTNPHHRQANGRTALHHAAEYGDARSVQHLIGASDLTAQDHDGLTPLMCAVDSINSTTKAVVLLIPGSDLRQTQHADGHGENAFRLALSRACYNDERWDQSLWAWGKTDTRNTPMWYWETVDLLAVHDPDPSSLSPLLREIESWKLPRWNIVMERKALNEVARASTIPSHEAFRSPSSPRKRL